MIGFYAKETTLLAISIMRFNGHNESQQGCTHATVVINGEGPDGRERIECYTELSTIVHYYANCNVY